MRAPYIRTASGRDVYLSDPGRSIVIEDIAASLAKICRYNGHTRVPYSVAQHSIWVARQIKASGYGAKLQLAGLMHDAAEAYLGDMPTPVQRFIFGDENSAAIKSKWSGAHAHFDHNITADILPAGYYLQWPDMTQALIKSFDLMARRTEWRDLMIGPEPVEFSNWPGPHAEIIRPFENWETAQEQFLVHFHTLTKQVESEARS